MKSMLLSLVVLCQFAVQSQTCIVIYVSHHGIIAGADRKYHQAMTGSGHTVYYGKKIFTTRNCAWALSGADYYNTIHSICRDVCRKQGSLNTTLKRFQERMQDKMLKKAMHNLFLASNEEQKKRFRGNLTELVFFKFEGHAYKACRITLSMPCIYKSDETIHFEMDSIVSTKNTVGIFVLGHYESFSNNTHPEKWVDPAAMIRKLIKQQSRFTPDEVSPDADILKVSRTGFTWLPGR